MEVCSEQQAVMIASIHQEEFFVAVDSNLGAVVGVEEGAIGSIPSNEGRIAQAWVNVRGGLRVFSMYFWHSEDWTPRSDEAQLEAVLKQARTTRHPLLTACDANMCPEDFEKSLWFQREQMHVVAPKEASTCRSKGPKGECNERVHDLRHFERQFEKERSYRWRWWKILTQDHIKQCFCGQRRKEDTGMERAEDAEGAAWLQWREVARKKHNRERQRRRRGKRGRRRQKNQESNRSRSG